MSTGSVVVFYFSIIIFLKVVGWYGYSISIY